MPRSGTSVGPHRVASRSMVSVSTMLSGTNTPVAARKGR